MAWCKEVDNAASTLMLETSLCAGLNFPRWLVPAERHERSSGFLKVDTSF